MLKNVDDNVYEENIVYKLILTSRGLNTKLGAEIFEIVLKKQPLFDKKILLISLPEYEIDEILAKDFDSNFIGMKDFSALNLFAGTIIPHYGYKDLKRYILKSGEALKAKYKQIYQVADNEVLILKIQDTREKHIIKQKRIRLEEDDYRLK